MAEKTLIRRMTEADVDAIHAIEAASFAIPWSREALLKEVTDNRLARYLVLEKDGEVVAYAGMWLVMDEGHITNIAVRPDQRRQGYGLAIVQALLQFAGDLELSFATLEVRRSNIAAQSLYHRAGFVDVGYRKHYYEDNKEDALLMCCEHLPEAREDCPWETEDEVAFE